MSMQFRKTAKHGWSASNFNCIITCTDGPYNWSSKVPRTYNFVISRLVCTSTVAKMMGHEVHLAWKYLLGEIA